MRSGVKLTNTDVQKIRRIAKSGTHTQNALAKEFHVSKQTISHIVRGLTWHNNGPGDPGPKLNLATATEIRRLAKKQKIDPKDPKAQSAISLLAKKYGVGFFAIRDILLDKYWTGHAA